MKIHLSPKNPGNHIPRPRITIQSNPILEFGSLKILGMSLDQGVGRYHQKVSNLRSDDVVDALCDENSGEAASEAGDWMQGGWDFLK